MSDQAQWAFPDELQPKSDEVAFDLRAALDAVVALRVEVPEDAFTASILGTERTGNGVVINEEGLVLTIGYLITEADSIWLKSHSGSVVPGHALAYDQATGLGLVVPLGKLDLPPEKVQAIVRALWGGDTEFDVAHDALRSANRQEPRRLGFICRGSNPSRSTASSGADRSR